MLGAPVWSRYGILCTGETYKERVRLTYAGGVAIENPAGVVDTSLEGNVRKAIAYSRAIRSKRMPS